MASYIDRVAWMVYRASGGVDPTAVETPLYRMYALLVLAKGVETTRRDVHDAWSAWQAGINQAHRNLVPFDELHPAVQALDQSYVDAIHRVALALGGGD